MIENIKRFVREHHILIVVIIAVLVICFLHWWFCCKDEHLAVKVKGGEAGTAVLDLTEYGGGIWRVLGMEIIGEREIKGEGEEEKMEEKWGRKGRGRKRREERKNVRYPFYVLNEEGIRNVKAFPHFGYTIFNEFTGDLLGMFNNSYEFIYGGGGKGRAVQKTFQDLSNKEIGEKFNSPDDDEVVKIVDRDQSFTLFDFLWCFDDVSSVPGFNYYSDLVGFLEENASGWISRVDFVGQTMRNDLGDGFKKSVDYTENTNVSDNIERKFAVSDKSDSKDMDEEAKRVLDICKANVRDWYANTKGMNEIIVNNFREEGNDIKKSRTRVAKDKFEVADIYPAHKTILFVLLLLMLFPLYKGEPSRYKKMIASYILYVNLFNSTCAARMDRVWNEAIGNKYVYRYLNLNGQNKKALMNDLMEHLGELEQKCQAEKLDALDFGDYSTFVGTLSRKTVISLYYSINDRLSGSQSAFQDEREGAQYVFLMYKEGEEVVMDRYPLFFDFQKIGYCSLKIESGRENMRVKRNVRGAMFFAGASSAQKSCTPFLTIAEDLSLGKTYGRSLGMLKNGYEICQMMFNSVEEMQKFFEVLTAIDDGGKKEIGFRELYPEKHLLSFYSFDHRNGRWVCHLSDNWTLGITLVDDIDIRVAALGEIEDEGGARAYLAEISVQDMSEAIKEELGRGDNINKSSDEECEKETCERNANEYARKDTKDEECLAIGAKILSKH